ncbi:MAG TPA: methyltransferase domain-containing protein [Sphingomicrobium sp.]|nr:methyltransferase domain-containing protein [Sphingomicrobium sp.]
MTTLATAKRLLLFICCLATAVGGYAIAAPTSGGPFQSVLADPIRPPEDVARDADRKPAQLLAFAGVHAGMTIAELAPGGGYFTRILTGAVGAKGHVYAITGRPSPALQALAQKRPNLTVVQASPGTIPVPGQVDLVWTTQNYHDFKNAKLPTGGDAAQAYNAAAFRVLKPGGTYFIEDHETARGAGATQTSTLHRIEDVVVKREVEAAGFKLEGESNLLRNPADPHTAKVTDPVIRGKTDQFILKFRKR